MGGRHGSSTCASQTSSGSSARTSSWPSVCGSSKEGFRTKVTVYASGNNIDFRFAHDEAHAFKAAIQELLLSPAHSAVPPAPAPEAQPTATADPVEQIERFGALRDKGLLSEEEFQAKKREILGL